VNTDICKVIHVGKNNRNYEYSMLGQKWQIVEKKNDLGIIINSDVQSKEQCMYAANKADRKGMVRITIIYML